MRRFADEDIRAFVDTAGRRWQLTSYADERATGDQRRPQEGRECAAMSQSSDGQECLGGESQPIRWRFPGRVGHSVTGR